MNERIEELLGLASEMGALNECLKALPLSGLERHIQKVKQIGEAAKTLAKRLSDMPMTPPSGV